MIRPPRGPPLPSPKNLSCRKERENEREKGGKKERKGKGLLQFLNGRTGKSFQLLNFVVRPARTLQTLLPKTGKKEHTSNLTSAIFGFAFLKHRSSFLARGQVTNRQQGKAVRNPLTCTEPSKPHSTRYFFKRKGKRESASPPSEILSQLRGSLLCFPFLASLGKEGCWGRTGGRKTANHPPPHPVFFSATTAPWAAGTISKPQ